MKRIIYPALVAILALTACQESFEDRCAREAKEYTKKKCPARVDQFTTIDSLVFERSTHTMHYYYTLTGAADNMEKFKESSGIIENELRNQLRNSTVIKAQKDAGYSFAYTYYSKKEYGRVLFEKTFTQNDYK